MKSPGTRVCSRISRREKSSRRIRRGRRSGNFPVNRIDPSDEERARIVACAIECDKALHRTVCLIYPCSLPDKSGHKMFRNSVAEVAVNGSGRLQRLPLSSLSGCSVVVSLHRSQGVFGPVSLPLMAGPFFFRRPRRVALEPRADRALGPLDSARLRRREELETDAQRLSTERAPEELAHVPQSALLLGAGELVRLGQQYVHRPPAGQKPAEHLAVERGQRGAGTHT